jgi:hypothetical protein
MSAAPRHLPSGHVDLGSQELGFEVSLCLIQLVLVRPVLPFRVRRSRTFEGASVRMHALVDAAQLRGYGSVSMSCGQIDGSMVGAAQSSGPRGANLGAYPRLGRLGRTVSAGMGLHDG